MARRRSHLEEKILFLVQAYKLPAPEREFRFHPTRLWRFDFAYPQVKIAIEAEGGIFIFGRHNRGAEFVKDSQKYNAAAVLGWRVLRYTTENYHDFVEDINAIFKESNQR